MGAASWRRLAHRRHRETQEMLDFCGEHGITATSSSSRCSKINEAYERMLASDVKYRFVIDMASLK
jgi:D-arabinose 1-dehydrogenase-like Zn-dependent alcohol dehydrogenase